MPGRESFWTLLLTGHSEVSLQSVYLLRVASTSRSSPSAQRKTKSPSLGALGQYMSLDGS